MSYMNTIDLSFSILEVLDNVLPITKPKTYLDMFITTKTNNHKVILVSDILLNNHHYSIYVVHDIYTKYNMEQLKHV